MSARPVDPNPLARWWQTRKRKWAWIVAAIVLLLAVIGSFGNDPAAPDVNPAVPVVPAATTQAVPDDVVGQDAATAEKRLAALGFTVTIESVDGRNVLVKSNWLVTTIDRTGATAVTLKVAKPTPTPTTTPEPPREPKPPAPQPEPPAPEPQPEPPAPEPQPEPEIYYSNCAEAKAAGVAPLHRGQPGYRSGLDRDDDGIACDK